MSDPKEKTGAPAAETPAGENPMVKKRWFGRGIYGSKDVPIRVLDACIGLMILAALVLTLWGATHSGFAIQFDTGVDDLTVETQKVQHGGTVAEPEAPLRPGYNLVGWSTTPEPEVHLWSFADATVQGDMTLYAVWEAASFPVKFDLAGGTVNGAAEASPTANCLCPKRRARFSPAGCTAARPSRRIPRSP